MYLDSNSLISFGLLKAEMTKKSNNIVFSNSEPLVINHIIEWFEKNYNILPNNWKWLIQFNKKIVNEESSLEIKSRELASFLFWIKNTRINKNNHFPKWVSYRGFDKGLFEPENKWGMLSIYCGNKNIQKFISNFLKKNYILLFNLSERKIIKYLNGLFCGDGGASLSKDVRRIFVASFEKQDLNNLMNLLRKFKINAYISGNEIFISNFYDLFNLYKNNIFITHPSKRLKLLEILLSYKQFQGNAIMIKNEFENKKIKIATEYESLWIFLSSRNDFFDNLFIFCKKIIEGSTSKFKHFPMEIKLHGLARKPKRFATAKIICSKNSLTHQELMQITGSTYPSIKHTIEHLASEGYVKKEYFQPFNQVKIFPTSKLFAEINSAAILRNKFLTRYTVPEVIQDAL